MATRALRTGYSTRAPPRKALARCFLLFLVHYVYLVQLRFLTLLLVFSMFLSLYLHVVLFLEVSHRGARLAPAPGPPDKACLAHLSPVSLLLLSLLSVLMLFLALSKFHAIVFISSRTASGSAQSRRHHSLISLRPRHWRTTRRRAPEETREGPS